MALRDVIAKLSIAIGTDTRGLESGMKKGKSELQEFGATAAKIAGIASAAMAALGASVLAAANKAADFADEIDKMSISTGLSKQSLQGLKYVADQTGVEFSTISENVSRLTKAMSDAAHGNTRQVEAFKALGLSVFDASGNLKSMETMFPDVIAALSRMMNETERNALAMDLFGESASKMVPRLAVLGEEGLQNMIDKSRELNLIMNDQGIASLVKYKDGMSTLGQQIGAVVRNSVMPFVETMNDKLIPVLSGTLQKIAEWQNNKARINSVIEEKAELNLLVNSITSVNATNENRIKLLKELQEKYPQFLNNLDTETITNQDLTDRLEDVNNLYAEKIKLILAEEVVARNKSGFTDLIEDELKLLKDLTEARRQLAWIKENNPDPGGLSYISTPYQPDAVQNAMASVTRLENKLQKNRDKQKAINDLILETVSLLDIQQSKVNQISKAIGYDPVTIPTEGGGVSNSSLITSGIIDPSSMLGLSPISQDFKTGLGVIEESVHSLGATLQQGQATIIDFSDTVQSSLADAASSFGEAIGDMLGGASDMGGVFDAILEGFGGFAQKMGKLMIAYGFSMVTFKKAFTNPWAAVAAGTALAALGSIIKNAAQSPDVSQGGSPAMATSSHASGAVAQSGTQRIELVWRRAGKDLVAILAAENRSRNSILAN